ncbi:MAG: efflux RND transporter periplasmic adaptor subunit, partial [Acidobacteriota bacterium]|nr:efflux RND transporter periplasmic adaptor subunit [Acidobacteriota bacterium]
MNRKRVIEGSFALFATGLIFWVIGCSRRPAPENKKPELVSNVAVIAVQRTTIPDWLEAVGTVQAARKSAVSSQITGNIVEIRAREGDRVHAGQVLAVIDDTQPLAAVAQSSAALAAAKNEVLVADSDFALAESTLARYQQLFDKKSVSPQEFDEVKARDAAATARRDLSRAEQDRASAALTQAQTSLSYTRMRAPFAGVITQKLSDVGTLATPGMAAFMMDDTRRYRLEASVDEDSIGVARLGVEIRVFIDSLGDAALTGNVAQVVPAADPASRSFLVKVDLPADARLRAGLFGRAHFLRGRREAILIPRSATVRHGQLQGVYVVGADSVASLRYVTLGSPENDQVEV